MITFVKRLFLSVATMGLIAAPIAVPAAVYAQELGKKVQCGADLDLTNAGKECATDDATATSRLNSIIKLVVNIFSLIVGVVAVIMIIVGGLKYITSGGDSGNVTGAKNTILYAVVGLVVVALAQFIVRFVLAKATVDTP